MVLALPLLFIAIPGCREIIPDSTQPSPMNLQFRLPLNSYYSFDNLQFNFYGIPVPFSEFRNSWTVVDTNATVLGFQGVTIAVDSIFTRSSSGRDSLVLIEHRYFRTENGNVLEYGFIARLLGQRDSIVLDPEWNKIFSPSGGANTLWTVETNDSLPGGVYGFFYSSRELLGTTINGVQTGVLAYHVEITGPSLDLHLWISDSPSCILIVEDDSDVYVNRMYRKLLLLRTP